MTFRFWVIKDSFSRRVCVALRPEDRLRTEKRLCVVRLVVASSCLVWIFAGATSLTSHAWQLQRLFGLYFFFGFVALVLLRFHVVNSSYRVAALAVDLIFVGATTALTGGAQSPFSLLWLLLVASAAYRWGALETLLTAAACVLSLLIEAGASRFWLNSFSGADTEPFLFERLLIRSIFLFAVALFLGFVAEREKASITGSNLLNRWVWQVNLISGMDRALELFFAQIVPLYLPLSATVALRKGPMEEVFTWEKASSAGDSGPPKVTHSVRFSVLEAVALSFPAHAWLFVRNSGRAERVLALDDNGREMRESCSTDLNSCLAAYEVGSLMVCSLSLGESWNGRLILNGPSLAWDRKYALRFLQSLATKVSPALQSICVLRDVRAQLGDQIRAGFTRELHDGTMQSLLSAEMHIEILKRHSLKPSSEIHRRLTAVQALIHDEVVNLRDLIEKAKPLNFTSNQLPDFLAELVEKFRRETGISTRLMVEESNITLPPEVCHQVVRIVHEGLSNIRRHSGARNAFISLAKEGEGQQMLLIADDGRGFGFRGRVTHTQLASSHRGPTVIKERVRSIGGTLTIDSTPDRGTRLEITFPDGSHD